MVREALILTPSVNFPKNIITYIKKHTYHNFFTCIARCFITVTTFTNFNISQNPMQLFDCIGITSKNCKKDIEKYPKYYVVTVIKHPAIAYK